MTRLAKKLWVSFAVVVALTLAFDQGSKAWARSSLPVGHAETVIGGYWDWELSFNPGAAFSTFVGGRLVLTLVAIGALVAIAVAVSRTRPEHRLQRVGLAAIAGGALGNLMDRVRDGAVTDFVRLHVHGHMWPIFNVADTALVIGVALLAIHGLRQTGQPRVAAV